MVEEGADDDDDEGTVKEEHSETLLSQMTEASQDYGTVKDFGNFLIEETQQLPASPPRQEKRRRLHHHRHGQD